MDINTILQSVFSESGLFAALTVGLIFWQSKTNQEREERLITTNKEREDTQNALNQEREKRYIATIDNMTVNVSERLTSVENNVQDIKELIKGGNQ